MGATGHIGRSGRAEVSTAARIALIMLVIGYVSYYSFISIDRWNTALCSLDYARIDSAAHNTSIGKFMWSNDANFNYWTQHISPILLLLSAYYLVSDAYWPIFVAQSFTIGAAAIPLFLIAARTLRNEWHALLVSVFYLCSGGLQMANLYDYHMISHEPLFLFLAFYALLEKRWTLYFVSLAMLAIIKEDSFILAGVVALYTALGEKEYKISAYAMTALAVYALIVFKVGYPYFRGEDTYEYSVYYGWLGSGPADIVRRFVTEPVQTISMLLSVDLRYDKWSEFVVEHGVVAPLFSPLGLMMLAPPSMELFLAEHPRLYGFAYHYPLKVIPVWSLAIVLALANIKKIILALQTRARMIPYIGAVRKASVVALAAVVAAYAAVEIYYLFAGPFDTFIMGVRVSVVDLRKPLLIQFAALGVLMVICAPGPTAGFIGKGAGTRAVLGFLVFIIVTRFYNATQTGALPFVSSLAGYMETIDTEHASRLVKAEGRIPAGATVVTNPGAFAHLHHHTETYISIPGYRPSASKKRIDYYLLDTKDVQGLHRHQIQLSQELLLNSNYGVVYEDDGIFIFKKGRDKRKDFQLYIDNFAASTARMKTFEKQAGPGSQMVDKTSPTGMSIVARNGSANEGYMIYGPYIRLAPGWYKALYRMKVDRITDETVCRIDVVTDFGKTVLAEKYVTSRDFGEKNKWRTYELGFDIIGAPADKLEFRVYYIGGADLYVDLVRADMTYDDFLANLNDRLDF